MGGFFGVTSHRNCVLDVFFGTDYHSHLGTRRGGMAAYDPEKGLQREIHNIENSPFRTKFEHILDHMSGTAAIGCISDSDPQPLLIRSNLGTYAISTIGVINNADELIKQYLSFSGGHFDAMTGGRINCNELIAALIDQKSSFAEGIRFAQSVIDGTAPFCSFGTTATSLPRVTAWDDSRSFSARTTKATASALNPLPA